MKPSSDIPDYAASAVGRARPTLAALAVAGLVAVAAAVAVLGTTTSGPGSTVHPKAPAVQYEPNYCEPDGTFCEPTYLSPPPAHPAPAGSGLLTSQRETPSG
ncbi:hypothetical protein [Desertibaculum subflavum]|uniref:hypothetical protein n=1 Tax=Desertibaculum subflavum TaxID=2268458 RepID=UPI000E66C7DA